MFERKRHMEARRTVICEARKVLLVSAASAALVPALAAAAGHFSIKLVGGTFLGFICGTANFCMLAATVMKIASPENTDPGLLKRAMRRSYALRMAFMAVFSAVSLAAIGVNPIAYALAMLIPSFAVRIRRK